MEKICVIGLGYVGLPLAVAFSSKHDVFGFDINKDRISELKSGRDRTHEVSKKDLKSAKKLKFIDNLDDLGHVEIFIVTVPTPIDKYKKPDLSPLIGACKMIGPKIKKGDIVVFESTVFPGCTEEICVPILEKNSGLKYNKDFFAGYSPERINPGDKIHRVTSITKVVSGSKKEIADRLVKLYGSIIKAGVYKASSIKVAEAAKVIENSQRDLNIAFVNELALIFDKLDIDTTEVLEAAGTKWNFLRFRPGLVGGHCIGVDPYYLTYKAESLGYHPEVILSGRRINDNMGIIISNKIVKLLSSKGNKIKGCNVLILGITFKEDCPDIRNSKVIDVIHELNSFGIKTHVYDPVADPNEVEREYGIELINKIDSKYSGIVLAVAHKNFAKINVKSFLGKNGIIYDIKGFYDRELVTARL